MTVTLASFRADFPEFTSTSKYPDSMVNFWLTISQYLINGSRWTATPCLPPSISPPPPPPPSTQLYDLGVELFIAHNIVLEAENLAAVTVNGQPGIQRQGAINNKSVSKVSVGYDTAGTLELDGGHWNLTTYGMRFLNLLRMMGSGGMQL